MPERHRFPYTRLRNLDRLPQVKVHTGQMSCKSSCGPVAEGFRRRAMVSKFGTFPKEIPPHGRRKFESRTPGNIYRLPHGKVNFPIVSRLARWPEGSGDIHWPQKLRPPQSSHHVSERCGFETPSLLGLHVGQNIFEKEFSSNFSRAFRVE